MKIGIIDVDSHNYPNLPIMKISAYHKSKGDEVSICDNGFEHFDKVYASKVFSFSKDIDYTPNCDEFIYGGSGYRMQVVDGKEIYKPGEIELPYDIEHIYPDYSLYEKYTRNHAYGFLTRGCPKGCSFCIVGKKEGLNTHTVADLKEFWDGQHYVEIMDSNILGGEYEETCRLLNELADTKCRIKFNQGFDINRMNEDYAKIIAKMNVDELHFAWDNPKDTKTPKALAEFRKQTDLNFRKLIVYVLTNYNSTEEEDLERIYTIRDLGYDPYMMIYGKYNLPRGHRLKAMQRWCNNKFVFRQCEDFNNYSRKKNKEI